MKPTNSRRKFIYQSAIFTAGLGLLDFNAFAGNSKDASIPKELQHYIPSEIHENNLRKTTLLGEKPIQLKGNVYDAHQNIIKDAEIMFWHNDAKGHFHNNKFRGKMLSNAKGAFTFASYKPGDYLLKDGHKLPSRAFLLVKAKGYKPQLSTLHFAHDGNCHIDTATYEQSAILPRPSLPTMKQGLGESIVTYHVYLQKDS